jgi:hypothetical protein
MADAALVHRTAAATPPPHGLAALCAALQVRPEPLQADIDAAIGDAVSTERVRRKHAKTEVGGHVAIDYSEPRLRIEVARHYGAAPRAAAVDALVADTHAALDVDTHSTLRFRPGVFDLARVADVAACTHLVVAGGGGSAFPLGVVAAPAMSRAPFANLLPSQVPTVDLFEVAVGAALVTALAGIAPLTTLTWRRCIFTESALFMPQNALRTLCVDGPGMLREDGTGMPDVTLTLDFGLAVHTDDIEVDIAYVVAFDDAHMPHAVQFRPCSANFIDVRNAEALRLRRFALAACTTELPGLLAQGGHPLLHLAVGGVATYDAVPPVCFPNKLPAAAARVLNLSTHALELVYARSRGAAVACDGPGVLPDAVLEPADAAALLAAVIKQQTRGQRGVVVLGAWLCVALGVFEPAAPFHGITTTPRVFTGPFAGAATAGADVIVRPPDATAAFPTLVLQLTTDVVPTAYPRLAPHTYYTEIWLVHSYPEGATVPTARALRARRTGNSELRYADLPRDATLGAFAFNARRDPCAYLVYPSSLADVDLPPGTVCLTDRTAAAKQWRGEIEAWARRTKITTPRASGWFSFSSLWPW